MSVSFKFANSKTFDTIPIAGTVCKLGDLKLRIAEKKKMSLATGAGLDFDFSITDATTGKVFVEDDLVPKNAKLIVKRMPAGRGGKGLRYRSSQVHEASKAKYVKDTKETPPLPAPSPSPSSTTTTTSSSSFSFSFSSSCAPPPPRLAPAPSATASMSSSSSSSSSSRRRSNSSSRGRSTLRGKWAAVLRARRATARGSSSNNDCYRARGSTRHARWPGRRHGGHGAMAAAGGRRGAGGLLNSRALRRGSYLAPSSVRSLPITCNYPSSTSIASKSCAPWLWKD
jgi:hypothetical protein